MTISRLAIDASRALVQHKTGTEWYSLEIVRAIAALPGRPSLSLYYRRGQDPSDLPADALLRPLTMPRIWTHLGLSGAMIRDSPDALFVPSHVIPIVHPRASTVTIHDLGYLSEPSAHPRVSRRHLDLATRWNARAARRIIAVSSQTRDDLVRLYRVPCEKVSVVHSGVNHTRFHPMHPADIDAVLGELGVRPPYLLFLSTVQPRKNLVRLLQAFESIDDTQLSLVVAGKSGWLSDAIEARVRSSPASSRIVRLGHVANSSVPALYGGAQAFVLPSTYEGFGMGIIEAMACGCPVITSDRSSMPEIAGDAALLVDPTDISAIRRAIVEIRHPDRRRHMIERGYRRARAFSWERCAVTTLSAIMGTVHPDVRAG